MSRRTLAGAVMAVPAAQAASAAILRRMMRHSASRLMAGDVDAFLKFYADDATLTFPGDNSWGPVYRGKHEIRAFLERFLRVGLQGELHEILVSGPPWNTTVCARFDDAAHAPDGALVYENRAVIFLKIRWAKIVSEEVFEDTEKVAAFDRWLEANEPATAVPA
jgi:ketosteroid isomerase-like protein